MKPNTQTAPYPTELDHLVTHLVHTTRPHWRFWLADVDRGQDSKGLTLFVLVVGPDSYRPDRQIRVNHLFPVPAASYDRRSWQRWLFERLSEVDRHELMEGFTINGDKPFASSHGPGNDPYLVRELGTDVDRRTSFQGVIKPPTDRA